MPSGKSFLILPDTRNVPLGNQDRNYPATEVREKEAGGSELIGLLNTVGSALPDDNYNAS